MKRGSTKVGSFRLLWLVLIGALVLSTASCEFFYRMFNQPPQAGFTVGPSTAGAAPFTVTVSAATSSDPDENIESYSWNFGDGATGSGAAASHTYTAEGTYTIVLTVTDKYGETDTATKTIYVTPEETGPSASFTANPTSGTSPLTVSFDAGDSTYDEGTIQSYSWNFGDGHTGVGVITSHTYSTSTAKTYTVTLTVRGTDGETSTATKSISVSTSSGGGTSTSDDPSARFDAAPTIGVAPLRCEFDPADSEAAEGHTLIKFIWSYGDGDSEWDINPNTMDHVFTTDTTSEIFSVTLIVLDNDAGNDSITKTVKVYNHKPIAGFEIGNPPGGDAGVGAIEYPNPNVPGNAPDADDLDEWIADDVTYGSLGAEATVTVVIRSMEIPDATWRALTTKANQEDLVMADGTSATTSSSPSAPHDYADHNYSYDPEGQKWTGDVWPAWFPALSGQAWGIKYLYIDWGDGSGEVQVAYTNTGDVVAWHDYAFSGSGAVTRTIKVTAEDWLGYKSAAFSRVVTLKEGHEGDTEI
ncbi:MAG: PKD domain-containing protein [Candidatus Bipolaricaulota bacterium]|nr:PKD domain-containing protein [Candidatus Bipolaricaulota bacterium]